MKRRVDFAAGLSQADIATIKRKGARHDVCRKIAGVARPGKTAQERARRKAKHAQG